MRDQEKETFLKGGHEVPFKPAKIVRDNSHWMASYDHQTDLKDIKKNFKDEDGCVIVGPKNINIAPLKKGEVGLGCTFAGQWEHRADPDDDERKRNRVILDEHRDFIAKNHESKNFSQRARTVGSFNPVRQRFGLPETPQEFKVKTIRTPSLAEQDRAWRAGQPIRSGQSKMSISPFPNYMENPPKELKRKMPVEGEPEAPPGFRLTHRQTITRPTPSVVCNMRNMKASFPSVFHRSAMR